MNENKYNTPEFEQVEMPEFDPQKFAESIRMEYTKTIIKELPADLYESVRREFAALGITNDAAVVLRAIAIMAKEYADRRSNVCSPPSASTTTVQSKPGNITVFTDGACEGNPGPGGWGAIVIYEDGSEQVFSGCDPDTTNNRMELMAAITALESVSEPSDIEIYSALSMLLTASRRAGRRRGRPRDGRSLTASLRSTLICGKDCLMILIDIKA